jgi:hypothetical protein
MQIKCTKDKQKLNQQNRSVEIADLRRTLELGKRNHVSVISAMDNDIQSQERQSRRHTDSHRAAMEKLERDTRAIENNMTSQWNAEMKQRNDLHVAMVNRAKECDLDRQRLITLVQQMITRSLEKTQSRSILLRTKIKQQVVEGEIWLKGLKNDVIKRGRHREEVVRGAITLQLTSDQQAEQNQLRLISRLEKDREMLTADATEEAKRIQQRFEKEFDLATQREQQTIETRKKELEDARAKRLTEKKQRIRELSSTFQTELDQKKELYDGQNAIKLAEYRNALLAIPVSNSSDKDHYLQIERAKACLGVLTRRISILQLER